MSESDGDIINSAVLCEARDEYMAQLIRVLSPLVYEGIHSIYQTALAVSKGDKPLCVFQQFLKEVQRWNQTILENEATRIIQKCPWVMDLVKAVFLTSIKILASVRLGGDDRNIKAKMPTRERFLHQVYIEAARSFYYNPYLFQTYLPYTQIQQNRQEAVSITSKAIEAAVGIMLPVQHILQEYLGETFQNNAPTLKKEESFELTGDQIMGDRDADADADADADIGDLNASSPQMDNELSDNELSDDENDDKKSTVSNESSGSDSSGNGSDNELDNEKDNKIPDVPPENDIQDHFLDNDNIKKIQLKKDDDDDGHSDISISSDDEQEFPLPPIKDNEKPDDEHHHGHHHHHEKKNDDTRKFF